MSTISNIHCNSFLVNQAMQSSSSQSSLSLEDQKASRLSHELLILRLTGGGFISLDKKAELLERGVSLEALEAIEASRGRLLGGMTSGADSEDALEDLVNTLKANLENDYEEELSEEDVELILEAFRGTVAAQKEDQSGEAHAKKECEKFIELEKSELIEAFRYILKRSKGKYMCGIDDMAMASIISSLISAVALLGVAYLQTATPPPAPVVTKPAIAFGAAEWVRYFGDIGTEPPFPADITEILKSPCPYWSSKKVEDTHLLMLIPQTVNGRPFTINLLGKMIKKPQGGGHSTKYYSYDNNTIEEYGNKGVSGSYWALVTKDVIPNSRNKTFDEQRSLLESSYAVPGALEMATAILMNHAKTGEKLYPNNPNTYTRCQEKVCDNKYRVGVGSFDSSGLDLDLNGHDDLRFDDNGLGGLRKFS